MRYRTGRPLGPQQAKRLIPFMQKELLYLHQKSLGPLPRHLTSCRKSCCGPASMVGATRRPIHVTRSGMEAHWLYVIAQSLKLNLASQDEDRKHILMHLIC